MTSAGDGLLVFASEPSGWQDDAMPKLVPALLINAFTAEAIAARSTVTGGKTASPAR